MYYNEKFWQGVEKFWQGVEKEDILNMSF